MRALSAATALLACSSAAFAAQTPGLAARDINGDGTVDAFYDPAQDMTFAADANLAASMGMEPTAPGVPGSADMASAQSFVQSLDLFGVTGWRLPKVTSFNCTDDGEGHITDCMPVASELGKLAGFEQFRNVQYGNAAYWLGSQVPDGWAQGYHTYFNATRLTLGFTNEGSAPLFVWAVRDGDIAAAPGALARVSEVPEAGTLWLLLPGLLMALLLRSGSVSSAALSQRRARRRPDRSGLLPA
jgi:hypothetical protein